MKGFLSDLKAMIVDEIQSWVITTVIKAAITKLVTMFNPVGAIIQAILAIYNTVMFFIERISQILTFVEAIINSVAEIATGAIGRAAAWIEQAMARTIPLIIAFLARLIGLSGISDKIKGIIRKVQSRVEQAVDKVVAKVIGGIGKLFGGKDRRGEVADPEKKAKIEVGLTALRQAEQARLKDGKLAPADALQLVVEVRRTHKVFKTLEAAPRGGHWHYSYTASPGETVEGAPTSGEIPARVEPLTEITFDASGFDIGEFERQVQEKETESKNMNEKQGLNNRGAFVARQKATGSGRDPTSAGAQRAFRTAAQLRRIESYMDDGMSEQDAINKVKDELKGLAATHRLDMVAGGTPTGLSLGGRNVNSSIGPQWTAAHRIGKLQTNVDNFVAKYKLTDEQKKAVLMNTKLRVIEESK